MNDTFLPFLIDFYPGIPATQSFPCHLSRHYENSSHVSCRVKKIHAMVKVDETGAKILSILFEKFAFFDFDM